MGPHLGIDTTCHLLTHAHGSKAGFTEGLERSYSLHFTKRLLQPQALGADIGA